MTGDTTSTSKIGLGEFIDLAHRVPPEKLDGLIALARELLAEEKRRRDEAAKAPRGPKP